MATKQAISRGYDLRISFKHSLSIADVLKGMKLKKAISFMENVVKGKETLNGKKYYSKASNEFLQLLKNALNNAKNKNLNEDKLFIKTIKVNKGPKIRGTKTRWKFRFRKLKSTHVEIVVEER